MENSNQTESSCPDLDRAFREADKLFDLWSETPNLKLSARDMLRQAWFRGYQQGKMDKYVEMTTIRSKGQ